jgi:putative oxidoreductase
MKKLMSTNYSAGAFNFAMLLLRFGIGLFMISHGYDKLVHFSNYATMNGGFMKFLGLNSHISLALDVFAEFFCSLFLIIGLFTRLSAIPLIIAMTVALFKVHNGDVFDEHGEKAAMYICVYLVILLLGPGKISVDGMSGK